MTIKSSVKSSSHFPLDYCIAMPNGRPRCDNTSVQPPSNIFQSKPNLIRACDMLGQPVTSGNTGEQAQSAQQAQSQQDAPYRLM